jgi:hypothetical protein
MPNGGPRAWYGGACEDVAQLSASCVGLPVSAYETTALPIFATVFFRGAPIEAVLQKQLRLSIAG